MTGWTYLTQLSMYITIIIASIAISFQKDTLTRKNFVILRMINAGKDERIRTLTGEKRKLEFIVAVRRAQAVRTTSSHVKFLEGGVGGEESHCDARSHRDDRRTTSKSAAGKLRSSGKVMLVKSTSTPLHEA